MAIEPSLHGYKMATRVSTALVGLKGGEVHPIEQVIPPLRRPRRRRRDDELVKETPEHVVVVLAAHDCITGAVKDRRRSDRPDV
jgi:hypothetical protein